MTSRIRLEYFSEDPIGFAAGDSNLYRYVGNSPTNATDPLGLWEEPNRQGQSWAKTVSEEGDMIRELAAIIHLNAEEYLKWLKPVGSSVRPQSIDEEVPAGCEYEVPNTVGVYTSKRTGNDFWNPFSHLVGTANKFRRMAIASGQKAASEGYKVVYKLNQDSDAVFKSLWTLDGITGIAFGGHGAAWEGQWYGYVAAPSTDASVTPSDVKPPYKLHAIGAYTCGSSNSVPNMGALPASWKDHLSRTGFFVGYFGSVNFFNNVGNQEVVCPMPENVSP